jgi:predicted ATPase
MRIRSIHATKVQPVKLFSVEDLSDVVVLAGPNGVGKTRLVQSLLNVFRNPQGGRERSEQVVRLILEATDQTERELWGKNVLDTNDQNDRQKLAGTLQKSRRRSYWQSSMINFDSDRTITQVQPFQFTWDYQDPSEESIGWDMSLRGLRDRFQDTLNSLFRKVRSRRESIAIRFDELGRKRQEMRHLTATQVLDQLDADHPDPTEPFKRAFSQLLAPKVLLEPDPKVQLLQYSVEGQSFPISSLSSGEREVVNIVFDFLLRSPSDCIVVFDEPELHLHPELSYKLLQTLKTIGQRNQFILCTHSPDIITASLDNSVVFVAPFKTEGANQAIPVNESDDTNEALKRLGQSVGIVALGKKLVLIEGAVSSLDKQTYGAILRDRFPNLVLVPSGGKNVVTSFELLHRQVLDKTIWGVDFFMVCDRDAVPTPRSSTQLASQRLRVLNRYHLENYFLEESVLAAAFEHLEPEGSWLRSPQQIRKALREIAQNYVPYATALATSAYFREQFGNVDIMAKDCFGKNTDELVAQLLARVAQEKVRATTALDEAAVEAHARAIAQELLDSLIQDTDEWKALIPGRQVLNTFAARAKLDSARIKTAYIKAAERQTVNPFQEIVEIFSSFNAISGN